jgi:Flp pilus assembly pilin Flp
MLRYLTSRDGAASAEYAMLLGIIGALVAIALFVFGGAVAEQMDSAANTLAQGGVPDQLASASSAGAGGVGAGSSGKASHGRGAAHANGGNGWGGGSGGGLGH